MYNSAQDLDYYTILWTELPEKFGDKKKHPVRALHRMLD